MSPNNHSINRSISKKSKKQEKQKADTLRVKTAEYRAISRFFARLAWKSLVPAFSLLCGLAWFGWLSSWRDIHTI